MRICCLCLVCCVAVATATETSPNAKGDWTCAVEVTRPPKKGKERDPAVANLWIPDGVERVRGLLVGGRIDLETRLCRDPQIRAACADAGLGVVYYQPHFSGTFPYAKGDCEERFLTSLRDLAAVSGRGEIERVPWLTVGHSTAGIFARNVAFWKPERTIGIVHLKSGNFQDGIQDRDASVAGVPFLSINGEFERFGPAGGDLGLGLRSEYSLHPEDKKKRNQTQW